ncbi:MAG: DUF3857 domain-containing protein [Prevotellaceae bacterium]|jgi:hypothetical protein|nr:DUF3857 domain-containing protein [Prevotellaceae bacterium]
MKTVKFMFFTIGMLLIGFVPGTAQNTSEAEFVKMTREYTINPDGSYDMRSTKQLKLFTHMSFNSLYGESFVVYNPDYQKLTINECYTIRADGKRIDAPRINAFNEVLPRFAANAPQHNQLREMVITHTGLELGATIYLDYTLHTQAGYSNGLMVNDVLQETSPVKEYTVSVEYPSDIALLYRQYNTTKPSHTEKDGKIKISWVAKDIAARSLEFFQPADGREAPRVAFTTVAGNKLVDLLAKQLTMPGNNIQNKVKELIADKTDNKQKTKVITDFVLNNIALTNVPLEYTGYKLRPVDEIFRTASGTAIEKASLLAAMLTSAGVKAVPVFTTPLWTGEGFSIIPQTTPDTNSFDFYLPGANEYPVLVENNEYVSPLRAETFMWDDENKNCYAIKQGGTEKIQPIMKSVGINYNYTISGKMNDKNEIVFEAAKNGGYEVLTSSNTKINSISDNDKEPKAMPVTNNNGYYTINLPTSNVGINSWRMNTFSAEPRKTLLEIPYPVSENYTYTCTLPGNMQLVNNSPDVKITNAVGEVVIAIKGNNNTINVTRNIKLNSSAIEPKNYKAFKELMDAWNTLNNQAIIVK